MNCPLPHHQMQRRWLIDKRRGGGGFCNLLVAIITLSTALFVLHSIGGLFHSSYALLRESKQEVALWTCAVKELED